MTSSGAGAECFVFGGNPGRTRFYRLNHSFLPRENLLGRGLRNQQVPKTSQLQVDGKARLIAYGNGVIGVVGPSGSLVSIDLTGRPRGISKQGIPMAPKVDIPDCIAASGDRLHIIHNNGAAVWDNRLGTVSAQVEGRFVSQLVHPRGWVLVEGREDDTSVSLHLLDHKGDPLILENCLEVPGMQYPQWTMPVGDSDAVYCAASRSGDVWKVGWSGGRKLVSPAEPCRATLAVDGGYLWFLPVGGEYDPVRIDLRTANPRKVPVRRPRSPFAAAFDTRSERGLVWLGFQDRPYLRGVRRDLPELAPVEVSDAAGPVKELAVAADPRGSALLLGLVEGEKDVRLQGWFLDETVEPVGMFGSSYPRDATVGPHLLVAAHHALVWYSDDNETQIFIYELE